MRKAFYPDQKLRSVMGPWCESEGSCTYHQVGHHNCMAITVVMEPGLHCGLPWAVAEYTDGRTEHINLLLMEEVTELQEKTSCPKKP